MSRVTHHPKAVLATTSPALHEILFCALLDRLSGRPEGAEVYEEMAKRHPDYTPTAFWCHLIAVAKRQLLFEGNNAAALVTLNCGLEPDLRFSPQGEEMIREALKPLLPQMCAREAPALHTLLG